MMETHGNVATKRRQRCAVASLSIGIVVIVLAGISIPVMHAIVKREVFKKVIIKNGSETYDMWRNTSVPVYMRFYVFDLTNPMDVIMGEKPIVVEKGPYTYHEQRVKVDIQHNNNGTVTFRQIKTYTFDRNMSCGSDEDVFTTANMPLLTLANWLLYEGSSIEKKWADYIEWLSGNLFITKSVKDIAFGYKDNLLTLGMVLDPSRFYTNVLGIFAGKNNTDDGVYTIFTGEIDISRLGVITRYNGSGNLKFWTTETANMVNGSDGTLAPPFLDKEKPLYMFVSDICRSVYGVYSGTTRSSQDIVLHRYRGNKDILMSGSDNPDNAGFCTPSGNCMGTGVLNLTVCKELDHFQIPIVASFPHFYMADQSYVDAIQGMHPDPEKHTTDVDVEPTTGIVMKIAKRLQINVFMENITFLKPMRNIRTMVYPILWLDEGMEIDDDHAQQIKQQLLIPIKVASIMQYISFALGSVLILIILTMVANDKRKERALSYPINDDSRHGDDDPLIG